eukprot:2306148-Amphidinium_carterae.1
MHARWDSCPVGSISAGKPSCSVPSMVCGTSRERKELLAQLEMPTLLSFNVKFCPMQSKTSYRPCVFSGIEPAIPRLEELLQPFQNAVAQRRI